MKLLFAFLFVAVSICPGPSWAQEEEAKESRSLSASSLNRIEVTGKLGIPLGQAAVIEATIVSGSEFRVKALVGKYLLKVTSVRDQPLPEPVMFEFRTRSLAAGVARDHFTLYELKKGHKTGSLSGAAVKELEKEYVGKEVRLFVYETGGFEGIPNGLPEGFPVWQGRAFHFGTYLVILEKR